MTRPDALAINCYRGPEVLEVLGYRADTTAGRLFKVLGVKSWERVLDKVFR